MGAKLREILLVDDQEADNFLHARVIRKMGCAETVTAKLNGREAIDYLTREVEGGIPLPPDIIFLDLNMPVMNGWEFLDAYEQLDSEQHAGVVVVMLTTSLNPDDRENAAKRGIVAGFERKPLTAESLRAVLLEHFPLVLE